MKETKKEIEWLGRTLTIKTGKLARQATSSALVQYGDTVVLATVVKSAQEREGIDFFPLVVDFEERLYAAGIIKGSRWVKREGRPTDESVLTGRMIDRSVRPLFNEKERNEIQVVLTVLSADKENDHDIVALIAASASLSVSGVYWAGPIGGIRIGRIGGKLIFNPTYEERANSDIDIIVAGTRERIVMIEAGANELPEKELSDAIMAGHEAIGKAIALIEDFKKDVPMPEHKMKEKRLDESEKKEQEGKDVAVKLAEDWLSQNIANVLFDRTYYTKGERKTAVEALKNALDQFLFEKSISRATRMQIIPGLVESSVEELVTSAILDQGKRVDGRALDEIRPLYAEAGVLPRNHGSGLFSRGETQVLSIITLGPPGVEQMLEGIEGQSTKRFMHHYNFPPYSVGEVKRLGSPGRREIGHGALAEKALEPVIPDKETFPYTIRIVSETLGSNGSSSMASVCGSSLALMDAGVPLKKAVAGIAMGLASNSDMKSWKVITDLQDLEDGKGGMDFKIAGTRDGITALQLDTKTIGLSQEIIEKALEEGRAARLRILDVMDSAIKEPRPDLSPYAPRVIVMHINPDKIRDVIGSGGKIINGIIEATGVAIDIEQDGTIFISGVEAEKCQEAVEWIENLTREVAVGEFFTGKVVRILDFGVFVELLPGRDGMVHVSELAPFRVNRPTDIVQVGDIVRVRVKEIDDQDRVNLTMVGIEENASYWTAYREKHAFNSEPFDRQNDRRPRGGFGPRRDDRRRQSKR